VRRSALSGDRGILEETSPIRPRGAGKTKTSIQLPELENEGKPTFEVMEPLAWIDEVATRSRQKQLRPLPLRASSSSLGRNEGLYYDFPAAVMNEKPPPETFRFKLPTSRVSSITDQHPSVSTASFHPHRKPGRRCRRENNSFRLLDIESAL
jgi:hypothetical protein